MGREKKHDRIRRHTGARGSDHAKVPHQRSPTSPQQEQSTMVGSTGEGFGSTPRHGTHFHVDNFGMVLTTTTGAEGEGDGVADGTTFASSCMSNRRDAVEADTP